MCGLAGIAGRGAFGRHMESFQELLWMTALRGRDSTGVFATKTYSKNPQSVLKKQDTDSSLFLFDHAHRRGFLNDSTYDLMMGHCRYATVGKVTTKNAHPYDVGNLVGAHNGTLMSREFYSPNKTDSEMMFEKMQSIGIKETLDTMSWSDAYAISVFEKASRKLFLARNDERPLFIGIGQKSDVLYWSSESLMLNLMARRNKLSIKILEIQPHFLYSFDMNEIRAGNDTPYKTTEIKHEDIPWGLLDASIQ